MNEASKTELSDGRHTRADSLEPFRVEPPAEYKPKQRPRNAQKRCFELAGRYALDHDDVLVVHGYAWGVPHAWVEIPGGIIYDGTCKGFYVADDYERCVEASPIRKMTSSELCDMCLEKGGMWCACHELETDANRLSTMIESSE